MPIPDPNHHTHRHGFVIKRFQNLADTLQDLKAKFRETLATELAGAIGTAVRDVLVVGMVDRLIARSRVRNDVPHSQPTVWRQDEDEDRWEAQTDHWPKDFTTRHGHARMTLESGDRGGGDLVSPMPTASAVAVGVQLGRWWLVRQGTTTTAVILGVLATALGFVGGPIARTALAVIAAATDLLSAESALAPIGHS